MIQLSKELANCFSLMTAEPIVKENEFSYRLIIPKDLTYFKGHFPDFPVLPAVALIDITTFLVRTHVVSNPNLELRKVDYFKIKRAVEPGQTVELSFQALPAQEYSIEWKNDNKAIAEMSLIFSS